MQLYFPFSIGYPVVTLGYGVKSYVGFKIRQVTNGHNCHGKSNVLFLVYCMCIYVGKNVYMHCCSKMSKVRRAD